jgi:excisionase family DNA binding protein
MKEEFQSYIDASKVDSKIKEMVLAAVQLELSSLKQSLLKDSSLNSYLTRMEASKFLNVHVRTLDRMSKAGKIPRQKLGVNILYSRSDIRLMLFLSEFKRLIGGFLND